jgi:hypothetical protein
MLYQNRPHGEPLSAQLCFDEGPAAGSFLQLGYTVFFPSLSFLMVSIVQRYLRFNLLYPSVRTD